MPSRSLAGAGLAIVVGLQAFINMAVALSLLPAKGMTLPFISYGGSSLFAVALTMGFALARHPPAHHHRRRARNRCSASLGGAGMSTIVLSAGGTGGHLFPAQALAAELIRRGRNIVVMTDARGKNYGAAFPGAAIETVPSASFADRNIVSLLLAPFEIRWRRCRSALGKLAQAEARRRRRASAAIPACR